MTHGPGTVQIEKLGEPEEDSGQMARDMRAGLSSTPKDLSPWPKYFYDAEGSRLFEEITALPEYYQMDAELSILRERAGEIVSRTGCRELVELGSGSSSKTRALLDATFEAQERVCYVPLDVSESAVRESGERLLTEYPELEVRGYVGDFEDSLGRFLNGTADSGEGDGGRLVIFLGGTIGNFTPDRRRSFLEEIHAGLRNGDYFLLGVDLVKDAQTLEAAYDDSAGVTERFNKNLLKVINERLGGNFDPDLFRYRAVYNAENQRVEMWLYSEVEQEIRLSDLDFEVSFGAGEGMLTEISTKFTLDSVARMFDAANMELLDLYTDERGFFGLALGKRSD